MARLSKEEMKKLVRKSNKNILCETSYNRIRQHIEGGEAFSMVTADRHEHSGKENLQRYKELKSDFKNAGFPFTEIKGGYKETTEVVVDPETGEEKQVSLEEPVFVTENTILITSHVRPDVPREEESSAKTLFDFTVKAAQRYGQEAFIFGETATSTSGKTFKDIRAYSSNGSEINEDWAGPWRSVETVQDDEAFWSRVKGKHFQLKEIEKLKTEQPKSWIEAMKKSRSGQTW
jgi:hypothetical protein